jgi:hypothetical protein
MRAARSVFIRFYRFKFFEALIVFKDNGASIFKVVRVNRMQCNNLLVLALVVFNVLMSFIIVVGLYYLGLDV